MTALSTAAAQINVPPATGWLTDLDEEQLPKLVGAMVNVTSGARTATGLITDIENGVAHIYRTDEADPLEFPVISTLYQRVPGTSMRPALARALAYQRSWDEQREELTDDDGNALNQYDYDKALGEWEWGLSDVYDDLISEAALLLFAPLTESAKAAG
ncbi:hypothetical protein [Streptomyces sp. NPDC057002]|uniref:hypothetical protein n=1 Tax=Streptomyces sp. NPDC057002 TaxID=3345992 RepID=UPI00362620C0